MRLPTGFLQYYFVFWEFVALTGERPLYFWYISSQRNWRSETALNNSKKKRRKKSPPSQEKTKIRKRENFTWWETANNTNLKCLFSTSTAKEQWCKIFASFSNQSGRYSAESWGKINLAERHSCDTFPQQCHMVLYIYFLIRSELEAIRYSLLTIMTNLLLIAYLTQFN